MDDYSQGYFDGFNGLPAQSTSPEYSEGYSRAYEETEKQSALVEIMENKNEHTRFNIGR